MIDQLIEDVLAGADPKQVLEARPIKLDQTYLRKLAGQLAEVYMDVLKQRKGAHVGWYGEIQFPYPKAMGRPASDRLTQLHQQHNRSGICHSGCRPH